MCVSHMIWVGCRIGPGSFDSVRACVRACTYRFSWYRTSTCATALPPHCPCRMACLSAKANVSHGAVFKVAQSSRASSKRLQVVAATKLSQKVLEHLVASELVDIDGVLFVCLCAAL